MTYNRKTDTSEPISKLRAISFIPVHNEHLVLGEKEGNACNDGTALNMIMGLTEKYFCSRIKKIRDAKYIADNNVVNV